MSNKDEDLRDLVRKERKEKEAQKEAKSVMVNREEVCPLLLRVFTSTARHNDVGEYDRGHTPENEIQIYTWLDATLKELTGLIKEVNPDARRRGTYFNYKLVYPDLRLGRCCTREIGSTIAGNKGVDDNKTLADCKFTIGDYLDVAISPPNQRGDRMDFNRRGGMDRFRGGGRRFGDDDRRDDRRGGFGGDRFGDRDRDDRRGGGDDRRGGGDDRRGGGDDRRGGGDDRRGGGDDRRDRDERRGGGGRDRRGDRSRSRDRSL